ncbi:hypothetical protein FO519_008765 [Halicephalobus sp. NKZ332]|nr:hypothetical protein FO519_008765 [Halicephalobus sp. NKZ332]
MAPSLILDNLCPKLETGKEITRALVGEFTGTFVLVLIINTISAQQTLSRPNQDLFVIAHLGAGLAVAFGVAIAAKISGGHINPAVTITMLTLQQIKTVKAILYILAQLAGAFVGAAVAYLFYHDTINYFDSGTRHVTGTQATAQIFASYLTPHLSICGGLVSQIIGTAVFVFFIIHFVDRRNSYPNWIQPFITGLVFLMIGTVFSSDTKYSLNPARDLGPRLFTCIIGYGIETFSFRDYNWFWVPLLGPILGGVVGGHLYQLFIEFYAPSENRSDIAFTDEYQPIVERGTTMEFDLLFCRLWQFLVGTVVFLLAKNYKDTLKSTESVTEYKFAVRFLATVLGGVIVYSGHYDQLPIPRTVDTFLTYLGDISYSFYLIHWPVILLGRYSYTDSTMSGLIAIVLICIIGSVLLYEFLDKVIPTKTTFVVFIQTGIVFTIIMMLCFNSFSLHSDILRQKFELHKDADANLSMKEIIKINEKFVLSCNKLPISNCHSDPTMNRIFSEFKHSINWVHSCAVDLHPNGTKTVALLGNSFAARFSVTAIEALKEFPSVRKMYLISRPDCTMFDTLNNGALRRWHCEEMVGQNIAFAREIRPDIIIHVAA